MAKERKGMGANKGFEVTNGNPVRQVNVTNGCSYYRVDLRHTAVGKAVRKNFTTAQKACSYASKTMAKAIKGSAPNTQSVDTHREAMEILNPFNVSVSEAARFYAKYHGAADQVDSIGRLVREYILEKQEEVDREELKPASLVDTRHFLKRFTKEFGARAVDLVTPGELDFFLDSLNGSANRRSHRLYLSAFFNWAVARDCLATNPIRKTRRSASRARTPQTYLPSEVAQLMCEAEPDLVSYLALSVFSGARSNEILQLKWSDIDFEHGEIKIRAKGSATGKARTLIMPENLSLFLVPHRDIGKSLVVPHGQRSLQRWMKKLFNGLGFKPVYQGARHSFATYHLALHPMVETMNELGCNSNSSLFKYCRTSTHKMKKQADAYFAIVPENQGEIIPLEKEAA
jgi:integrase